MAGYIDETMSAQFVLGQTFNFSPTLRHWATPTTSRRLERCRNCLVEKAARPGQGTVSIHTQPKGAQVAINQHMLERIRPSM